MASAQTLAKRALLVVAATLLLSAVVLGAKPDRKPLLKFHTQPPTDITAGEEFEFTVSGPEKLDGKKVGILVRPKTPNVVGKGSFTNRTLTDIGDITQAAFTFTLARPGVYQLAAVAGKGVFGRSRRIVVRSSDGKTTRFILPPRQAKRVPTAVVAGDHLARFIVRGDPGATEEVKVELYNDEGKHVRTLQTVKFEPNKAGNASIARVGGFTFPKDIDHGSYKFAVRSSGHKLYTKDDDDKVVERQFPLEVLASSKLSFASAPANTVEARKVIPAIHIQGVEGERSLVNATLTTTDGGVPKARLLGKKRSQFDGGNLATATFRALAISRPGTYTLRFTTLAGAKLEHVIKVTGQEKKEGEKKTGGTAAKLADQTLQQEEEEAGDVALLQTSEHVRRLVRQRSSCRRYVDGMCMEWTTVSEE